MSQNYFEQTWTFFLYCVIGTIWRYIEKDFLGDWNNYFKPEFGIRIVYHTGNIILLGALLYYLNFV